MIHRRFCKFALGLPTSATNIAAYGEIGRVLLSIRYKIALLKYWVRISTSQNISPLLGEVYELISDDPSNTWLREIQGILYAWPNPLGVNPTELLSNLRQRLYDQYLQKWNGSLMASNKLRTYRLFKNTLEYEPYLHTSESLSHVSDVVLMA